MTFPRLAVHVAIGFVLLGGRQGESQSAPLRVPRGSVPTIDGRLDAEEWRDARSYPTGDGGAVLLKHDGTYLFIGMRTASQGFPSLCAVRGDTVRILHASAALGLVPYIKRGDAWLPTVTAFSYGMRNTDTTDAVRTEREAYLAQNGWVANTVPMGSGREKEMIISLEFLDPERPRIAMGYFQIGQPNQLVRPWPSSLGDGCVAERLVTGYVPARLTFTSASWAQLTLDR